MRMNLMTGAILCTIFVILNSPFLTALPTQIITYLNDESLNKTVYTTSSNDNAPVVVYGGSRSLTLMDILLHNRNARPVLNVSCVVQELQPEFLISSFQFCFKRLLTQNPTCVDMQPNFKLNSVDFTSQLNGKTGAYVISNWANLMDVLANRPDLSGFYFCRLENRMGPVESAMVRVRDYMKKTIDLMGYFPFDLSQNQLRNTALEPKDLPFLFECGNPSKAILPVPESITNEPRVPAPYKWVICQDSEGKTEYNEQECIGESPNMKTVYIPDMGENYILPNGTLVLSEFRPTTPASVLMICQSFRASQGEYNQLYASSKTNDKYKLLKINKNGASYSGPVVVLGPQLQTVKLLAAEFSSPIKLMALYKAEPKVVRTWKKDGQPIDLNLLNSGKTDSYHLTFSKTITIGHAGKYELLLDDVVYFTFQVLVSKIIQITNGPDIPRQVYRMNAESVTLNFSISDEISKKKIFINGKQLDLSSAQSTSESVKNIDKPTSLRDLDILVTPTEDSGLNTNAQTLTYNARNLVYKKTDDFGQSHIVTFVAMNDDSQVTVNTIVKVLPDPDALTYPKASDCLGTACKSSDDHVFDCQFATNKYRNEGVLMRKFWYLGNNTLLGRDVLEVSKNFTIDPMNYFLLGDNNDTLALSKIENETTYDGVFKGFLKNTTVTCRMILMVDDEGTGAGLSLDDLLLSGKLLFDSFAETYKFRSFMTARIQYYEAPVAGASLGWIAGVVVGVLLLVLLIVILIFWLRRDKKETYKVAEEEIEHGNDPLKEIKENEEFHVYTRGDGTDEHLIGNSPSGGKLDGRRLSLDNSSIGVNDDNELDEYALDDTKYNEDGSFVDEYRPHPRSGQQAPPSAAAGLNSNEDTDI